MPSKRATLATIADAAGVSVATVSKVLNGRDDVAPGTRAMVEDLLEQHYYVGRTPGRHPTIELLFLGPMSAYCSEVLTGVTHAAGESGVSVVLRVGRPVAGAKTVTAWALDLAAAGRQAVISVTDEMLPDEMEALARVDIPLVVVDPFNLPEGAVTSVGSTNYTGGQAAGRHLLGLGHRRVGYVGGPATAACNLARMHGFRGAMETAGAPVPDGLVRFGGFDYETGVTEGGALLDRPQPPTAIFAGNDETAVGVIEAARLRGLRVPEDLSVVGFDGTDLTEHAHPRLTSVAQPLREMGLTALRAVLRLAEGQELESHHVELATQLVVRDSTAPAAVPVRPRRPAGPAAAAGRR